MNQKRNKIIILIGVLLVIICLLFIICNNKAENYYIQQKCPISSKIGFAVCEIYYKEGSNNLKEARMINKFNTEGDAKYIIPEETSVLINIDLYNILSKTQLSLAKQIIFKKISLCAQLSNNISDITIYSKNTTNLINDNIICFKPSYLYFNRPKFIITGQTKQIETDNIPVVLNVYQVPNETIFNTPNEDTILKYLNNNSFLFKILLFRISKK